MSTTRVTALLAAALIGLVGCGSDEGGETTTSSIPESKPFNQSDVDFATEMIPHHAQALLMVDAAAPRDDLSPQLAGLVESIRTEQTGEIELMTDWLEDWDQPLPDNPRDHGGMAEGHGDDMADMPGMASQDELDALGDASGDAFEEMWLTMMIAHHEGAIEMAEEQAADGEFPEAVDLAEQIADAQAQEIEKMEQLLG